MNRLEKAKDLFIYHNCSYQYLHSESKLDEYLSYNVDKNTEIIWIREFINNTINSINSNNLRNNTYKLLKCDIFKFSDLVTNLCRKIHDVYLDMNDVDSILVCMDLNNIKNKTKNNKVKKDIILIIKMILLKIDRDNIDTTSIKETEFRTRDELNKIYLHRYDGLINEINI